MWTGLCWPEAEINQIWSWPGPAHRVEVGANPDVPDWNFGVPPGKLAGSGFPLRFTLFSQLCLGGLAGPRDPVVGWMDRPPHKPSPPSGQARGATTLNSGKPSPTASTACPSLPLWTRRSFAATEVRTALGKAQPHRWGPWGEGVCWRTCSQSPGRAFPGVWAWMSPPLASVRLYCLLLWPQHCAWNLEVSFL